MSQASRSCQAGASAESQSARAASHSAHPCPSCLPSALSTPGVQVQAQWKEHPRSSCLLGLRAQVMGSLFLHCPQGKDNGTMPTFPSQSWSPGLRTQAERLLSPGKGWVSENAAFPRVCPSLPSSPPLSSFSSSGSLLIGHCVHPGGSLEVGGAFSLHPLGHGVPVPA